MTKVTVRDIVNVLGFKVFHGEEFLNREIFTSELSRPGVELAGHFEYHAPDRIQVFGMAEMSFIDNLSSDRIDTIMQQLSAYQTPAFIFSRNLQPPQQIVVQAEKAGIPILITPSKTTSAISKLTSFLENKLAVRISVHGVFVDVHGIGVLIKGDSGVGKSETALELIQKGHRLVADDRIDFYQSDESTLIGEPPEILKNLLEVRGIGIIDVSTLFGTGSVRESKKLDIIVNLKLWQEDLEFDRLGNHQEQVRILDVDVPQFTIPVKLGRNIANIVEVATMNFRAKSMGFDATAQFEANLSKLIQTNYEQENDV